MLGGFTKVIRIHQMEDILLDKWRLWPAGALAEKSVGFILWGSGISGQNFLAIQQIVNESLSQSGRRANRHCHPSGHTARMAKSDVWGGTVNKGLGNTWHVHAPTIFVTAVIRSDMWSIWLMAETWKSHRRINSPFRVLALVCLKS